MPLDDQLLYRARRHDPRALETVLASLYPAVHRLACALTGREDVARGIVHFVMCRAPRHVRQWRDEDAAERWFYHYTILTARRTAHHQPQPPQDALATADAQPTAAYIAFVRALRTLPFQQREAFLLHNGERLDPRSMGAAMDCSATAAESHLHSATAALAPIAGPAFPAMKDRLLQAYHALRPDDYIANSARQYVARSLLPLRLKRLVKLVLTLIVLGAVAWVGWHWRTLWMAK